VTPQHFADHLEALQKNYHPVSLKELTHAIKEGRIPDNAIAVTFDDGYADNLYAAKPLLEHYNTPATVFVTAGYIGQEKKFNWDESNADADHRPLSADEVLKLAEGNLIEIGAHTMTHPVLSNLAIAEQRTEIFKSKTFLEKILQRPISSFAYPYGARSDYTRDTVSIIEEAGFDCACSNFPGFVRKGADIYELPRVLVRDWDGREFIRRLKKNG
jgi:peptidoglycan/xylan/chitin deacetylase (PgdA/CDA1 family)